MLRIWTGKLPCAANRRTFISLLCLFLLTFLFTYYTVNRSSSLIAKTTNRDRHGIYGDIRDVPESGRIYSSRDKDVSKSLPGQAERNVATSEGVEGKNSRMEEGTNNKINANDGTAESNEQHIRLPDQGEMSEMEDESLPEDSELYQAQIYDTTAGDNIILDEAMTLSIRTESHRLIEPPSPIAFQSEYSETDLEASADQDTKSITGNFGANQRDEPVIFNGDLDEEEYADSDDKNSDEFYTSYELDEDYDTTYDNEIKAAYPEGGKKSLYNGGDRHSENREEFVGIIDDSNHIPLKVDSARINNLNLRIPTLETEGENGINEKRGSEALNSETRVPTSPGAVGSTDVLNRSVIFYKPEEVNIMASRPFRFLENYKNPCWLETVSSWYMDNTYLKVRNIRSVLTNMSAVLRTRQAKGDYHRVRCLPYFFMIGQPKCGSSDLYEKLMAHPDAVRPPIKEPHWWARARLGRHRAYGHLVPIQHYTDIFDYAAYIIEHHQTVLMESGRRYHNMITGEGSMSTFWDNDHWWNLIGNENASEPRLLNPDYIRHILPLSKLILILRNPSTRMYSDYLYFRKVNKSRDDFHNVVVNAIEVYKNCTMDNSLRRCLYNRTIADLARIRLRVGIYAPYLEDWFRVFPRQQFFIVKTEEYAVKPRTILKRMYDFHGLRQLPLDQENRVLSMTKVNTRTTADRALGDMFPETRKLLDEFYGPYNAQLAELLRDSRFLWTEDVGKR